MKRLLSIIALVVACQASATNIWYVSRSAAPGGDGSSEAPFQSIQSAIAEASEDDIVKVGPGTYDQDEIDDGYMKSRVVITKRLTLEATGRKDETFIVGRKSSAADGYGDDAVRCIYAGNFGATIKGFTIAGGGVASTDDSPKGSGGGVCGVDGAKDSVWVVDCVISNCVGVRGGAMRAATAFRSLIVGNSRVGLGNGAAGRDAAFYNCVITGNKPLNQPLLHNCNVVNCTVFGNATGSLWSGAYVRNSLFFKNVGTTADLLDARNNVMDVAETDFSARDDGKGHVVADNAVNVSSYQVRSPFAEDLRPFVGTEAATAGASDKMKIYGVAVPEDYLYVDFLGHDIPREGTICAGAVQGLAEPPTSGGIALNGVDGFKVFGSPMQVNGLWAYPKAYPAQIHLTAKDIAAKHVFAYWVSSDTQANWRAPEMDDSFYVLPPATAGELLPVGIRVATDDWVRYVDPDPAKGDDANNSGKTADKPFRTLQKAADSLTGSYVNCVVYCSAGDYGEDQGSTLCNGNDRRLVKNDAKWYVRFKGAGKGRSVISGRADSQTGACGETDTCGGVYLGGSCILQGFTLKDCYGRVGGGDLGYGGAGVVGAANTRISDCRFDNCNGDKGAIGFYCGYARCEFLNSAGQTSCFRGVSWFVNCLFDGNGGGTQGVIQEGPAYNCTLRANATNTKNYAGGLSLRNSIITHCMESSSGGKLSDCIVWDTGYFATTTGFTKVDPKFVSAADLRILGSSPALTLGGTIADAYLLYCSGDLLGRPMNFSASGAVTVGCYQYPVSVLTVAEPVYGTVTPSGSVAVDAGESVEFSYAVDADHPRQQIGYWAGGEFLPSVGGKATYTAPAAGEPAVTIPFAVAFETNWYVNANAVDDSGDGFTPETAKKTLRAVMEDCAVIAGDTVHAAAGDYDEGLMATPTGDYTTSNRVCIASSVTLVADDGPAVTKIVGQASPNPYNADSYGRGPCAARCAYLATGSRLVGFTVTGGRTDNSQTGDNLYSSGGGLYCVNAAESAVALVENCTITANYGVRGGGTYAGKFVNCRFGNNVGNGAQGEDSRIAYHYGCIFTPSVGNRNVMAPNCVEQCVFAPNTCVYGGAPTYKGCVFLQTTLKEGVAAGTKMEDCVYLAGSKFEEYVNAGTITTTRCFAVTSAADLRLDANYVPQKGSPLIDRGPEGAVSASYRGLDNRQSQRVYNGRIDIGANEYDWRADFGALLGVTVEAASPEVTAQTAALRVPADSSLQVSWQPPVGKKASFDAQVTGTGLLAVTHNDAPLAALTAADGRQTVKFRAAGENVLDFAFADGTGYADVGNFMNSPGMLLLLR